MNLNDFESGVGTRIRDDAGKLDVTTDIDDAISQAVRQRYSKDRPRFLVSDIIGVNPPSNYLPLPTGPGDPPEQFEDGFSTIRNIEYPVGQIPPAYLLDGDWMLYRSPSGLQVLLMALTPQTTDTLRITWTLRHSPGSGGTQSPSDTTVPDADFEAVCDLAASLCATKLAAIYAQTRDATIGADVVNYRTKSQEYLTLSKALQQRYFDHVGVEDGAKGGGPGAPAIAIGDMYLQQGSGVDRLTHRRPR